jgi:hypothetical protein
LQNNLHLNELFTKTMVRLDLLSGRVVVRLTDKEQQTIDEFRNWLVQPDTGTWIYYTGDLTTDAVARDFPVVVRSLAWMAMAKGRIRLFQRRKKLGVFDYVAVKRPHSVSL